MGRILAKLETRCQEHPHRTYEARCDRCGLPFCGACLHPSARRADGSRHWFCARCVALLDEESRRRVREATLAYRAARAAARARTTGIALGAAGLLIVATGAGYFAFARAFATGTEQALPERAASCGELSRIRSIGAIGTQAGEDALNVLAYPRRAQVRLVPAPAPAGAAPAVASPAAAAGPASAASQASSQPTRGVEAVVDECDAGWRHEGPLTLPATIELDTGRQGSYVQRIALWQDPQAPRDAWVRDFELFASATDAGDDFVPLTLDRPAQLRDSTEPQWFEVVRRSPSGQQQPFPDVVEMRRLRVRMLSTFGSSEDSQAGRGSGAPVDVGGVALGEVGAFGPDVEIVIDHPSNGGDKDRSAFIFGPPVVNALARRPKFVLFINRSTTAAPHHIVTVGQEQNLEVKMAPGEARSGLFIAGRPGTYEFFCRTPGHVELGLTGRVVVR